MRSYLRSGGVDIIDEMDKEGSLKATLAGDEDGDEDETIEAVDSLKSRAAKRGGFKRGGFPIWTCPSFFVLFCPFWDFPDLLGDFPDLLRDGPGIFPICPFPLSRPIKSTYEEQSRKGPRHNLDLPRKKWETPGFGNPPV